MFKTDRIEIAKLFAAVCFGYLAGTWAYQYSGNSVLSIISSALGIVTAYYAVSFIFGRLNTGN
ncbi:hypothetical protein [Methanoplanus endosymbiosus]|uniref:Uncharacterized protein n=1 Tax=Methanoplanus endosymbiosus TaxID=33865 RepID=A0A9E7PM19_9EURY|nr:hypothetical protein [Methanoplanus endosymbiosus]UUX92674.1 hypothetical protein L6E24_00670 [Methanoplanus endosymbiosus]